MPFRPSDTRQVRRHRLSEGLESDVPAPAALELRVYGGMPSQRLDLKLFVDDAGAVTIDVVDNVTNLKASRRVQLQRSRVDTVRAAILESGILDIEATPPPLPPDSVVGTLRITTPPVTAHWTFAGDIDQAQVLHDEAPLELIRAVGPLMTLGKDVLEIATINPNLVGDSAGPLYIVSADYEARSGRRTSNEIVLYNLRPEKLDVGGFVVRDLLELDYQIPEGTLIESHGILRLPRRSFYSVLSTDAAKEIGGNVATILDRDGIEIARRVYWARR